MIKQPSPFITLLRLMLAILILSLFFLNTITFDIPAGKVGLFSYLYPIPQHFLSHPLYSEIAILLYLLTPFYPLSKLFIAILPKHESFSEYIQSLFDQIPEEYEPLVLLTIPAIFFLLIIIIVESI